MFCGCPFLDPHLTTYHPNIDVHIIVVLEPLPYSHAMRLVHVMWVVCTHFCFVFKPKKIRIQLYTWFYEHRSMFVFLGGLGGGWMTSKKHTYCLLGK